jgi:hypothetical protein
MFQSPVKCLFTKKNPNAEPTTNFVADSASGFFSEGMPPGAQIPEQTGTLFLPCGTSNKLGKIHRTNG